MELIQQKMDALLMDEDTMVYYHNLGVKPKFFFLVIRYIKKLIGFLYENSSEADQKVKRILLSKLNHMEKSEKQNHLPVNWEKIDEPEDIIR